MDTNILASEIEFYDEHRDQFASDYPGRFLLIHGCKLHGSFDTLDAAIAEGFRQFGSNPFLARRAGEGAIEASIPALTIGVPLVVNPKRPV